MNEATRVRLEALIQLTLTEMEISPVHEPMTPSRSAISWKNINSL